MNETNCNLWDWNIKSVPGTLNQFQCLTKLHTPVPEVTRAERTEND